MALFGFAPENPSGSGYFRPEDLSPEVIEAIMRRFGAVANSQPGGEQPGIQTDPGPIRNPPLDTSGTRLDYKLATGAAPAPAAPAAAPAATPAARGGGGLLGIFGGSGDPLYGDLLTEQQQRSLRSRGLLAMAASLAKSAQGTASGARIPFGAALGDAAGAWGTGEDEAALKALQIQKLGSEVAQARALAEFRKQFPGQQKKFDEIFAKVSGQPSALGGAPGGPLAVPTPTVGGPTPAGPLGDPAAMPAPAAAPQPPRTVGGYSVGSGFSPRPLSLDGGSGSSLLASAVNQVAPDVLPPGYTLRVTSGERPGATVRGTGGTSQHALANAIDFRIYDPQGNKIPNTGEDTTGLYGRTALAVRASLPDEMRSKVGWGGNFTTGGNGPKDLMHLDLAGDRGRYGTLAAMSNADTVYRPPGSGPSLPLRTVADTGGGGGAPAATGGGGGGAPAATGDGGGLPAGFPNASQFIPKDLPAVPPTQIPQLLGALAGLRANTIMGFGVDPYAPYLEAIHSLPQYIENKAAIEARVKTIYGYSSAEHNVALQAALAKARAEAENKAKWLSPEYDITRQGQLAEAKTGAEERAKEPFTQRAETYKSNEEIRRDAAKTFNDTLADFDKQRFAAGLTPGTAAPRIINGQRVMVPQTRLQEAQGADPAAGSAVPSMPTPNFNAPLPPLPTVGGPTAPPSGAAPGGPLAAPAPQTPQPPAAGGPLAAPPAAGSPAAGSPAPFNPLGPLSAPAPTAQPAGRLPGDTFYPPYETTEEKSYKEKSGNELVAAEKTIRDQAIAAEAIKSNVLGVSANLQNIHQGYGADAALNLAKLMQVVNPNFNAYVGNATAAEKAVLLDAAAQLKQTDPQPSLPQVQQFINAQQVRINSEGANQRIADRILGGQNEKIAKASMLEKFINDPQAGNGTSKGFEAYWRTNTSPTAFYFERLPRDQQAKIIESLDRTPAGKREKTRLESQLGFIINNGLVR